MSLTVEQLATREADLRQEISDRERLLVAYQLIRTDLEKSLHFAPHPVASNDEREASAHPQPVASPAVPATPVHVLPEVNLEALSKGYGGGIRLVTWAIRQMTGNFTVRHIAAVLRQAGCPMRVAKVSVVLNRMKDEGKIEELTTGRGRTPSVFCATPRVMARPLELSARHRSTHRAVLYRVFH